MKVIEKRTPTARKAYKCEASEFIRNVYGDRPTSVLKCNMIEYSNWLKAKNNNFNIQPGDKYIDLYMKLDDKTTKHWKAIPAMYAIFLNKIN